MTEINRFYQISCTSQQFFEFVEEYKERVNALADELIHMQYAALISEDEMALVSQQLGYDIASPLKNYKKSDLSLVSTVYYRLVDADDKIRKSKSYILPDYNYMARLSFFSIQDSFYMKLTATQSLYFELIESNPEVRRLQEDASVLNGVNFDYAYTRELYTHIRGIRPRALLEILNGRYTYVKRIQTLAQRILKAELEATKPEFKDLPEDKKIAFFVSPDCRVRLQAISTQLEPYMQGTYTADYLLQK